MDQLLGLVLISFITISILIVPFIDFLFYLRRKFMVDDFLSKPEVGKDSQTPIHDQLMKADFGTPHGGGLILIPILTILSLAASFIQTGGVNEELVVILLTLNGFGALGLVDDIKHLVQRRAGKFRGLPARVILLVQVILAVLSASALFYFLGFDNIFIPIFGNFILGWWYVPLASVAIVVFANGYNISDGLDGLSTGLLTICLVAFLVLAHTVFNPTLSTFVGIWLGALIAYLYFNVYPARVYLGDAGAFGFGATLAVIGLLTGKIVALGVIGGVYLVILASSFLQIASKRMFHRKLFPVAPIHMYFKYIGWPESKIVARFWLVGALCAVFGLWLALVSD